MREYLDLLRRVLTEGEEHADRTGVGTRSLFGQQLEFDMSEGFPILTTRRIPFRWAACELLWQLSGSTDERELSAQGVYTWAKWATADACERFERQPGDLGPTYGHLIRRFGGRTLPTARVRELYKIMTPEEQGVDQLYRLCYLMDTEPNSRRLVVSQWDPITVNGLTVPPCQISWQVKLHGDDGISLRVDQRSADVFVGLSFDITHFGLLLCLLGRLTGRAPRRLVFQLGDAHVYNSHLQQAEYLLTRSPRKRPWLEADLELTHGMGCGPGFDTLTNLLRVKPEQLRLVSYDPHPSMKAEVVE